LDINVTNPDEDSDKDCADEFEFIQATSITENLQSIQADGIIALSPTNM